MSVITAKQASALERAAYQSSLAEIATYLQSQLGQRMAAHLAGLSDTRQIGRYARDQHKPSPPVERRLREGFKTVHMIADTYDSDTAKAWLFGTNTRLDDRAPIEVLGQAVATEEFAAVLRAARQFASLDG
jgi:hypothetical protein